MARYWIDVYAYRGNEAVRHSTIAILLIAAAGWSCRTGQGTQVAAAPKSAGADKAPAIIQPGAPGQPSREITEDKATDLSKVQQTAADVKFMQGMIGHHAQAVEMVDLLRTRTSRKDMQMLGQRIALSQEDEIKMMQRWLQVHGQEVPGPHAMHMHGATLMPGMLTPEAMERLAQAKGTEFDRLFLEGMIKHHGGALTMVQELFATPGAGQEAEIFAFASDVDADQRMEIDRMAAMLKELEK
jgi:uncharacterized protein (DUF305 family)